MDLDCSNGFLYCRGVDDARVAKIHDVVLHRFVDSKGTDWGIAKNADGLWMSQIGRNLIDAVEGILRDKHYLDS